MWYKLFSQLVGQILLWIREPNICDWVRHLNQLPGKWEITPGAVLNTENQKSGKGGQHSSVWERRHPMHTDSEINHSPAQISLSHVCLRVRSPRHRSRRRALRWLWWARDGASLGQAQLELGMGRACTGGGRGGRERGPFWRSHLALTVCTRWLVGGTWSTPAYGTRFLSLALSSTPLRYLAHLLIETGDSSFTWWQVLVGGWTGRPLLINQGNNSWKCWPPGASVTQRGNPRCRGFALKDSFSGCVASSPPSPLLLCHCLVILVSRRKPTGLVRCTQKSQMSRRVSYMIQSCYVIAVWRSCFHRGWTGPGCWAATRQIPGLTRVKSEGELLQQGRGGHVFLKRARPDP